MVFFTCNHCGESVKKSSVAKHYQWKCRGAPVFVSCMDCQKDFRDEEYVAHTSCITEAEKYSGKDYVPKASNMAGQRKQESWLEIVRSILTTKEYDVSPAVRSIFQKLQSYDNVPRKKAKFLNFVTNCMRLKSNQAEAVWNVVEVALEKFKAARPVAASAKPVEGSADDGNTNESAEGAPNCNVVHENGTGDATEKTESRKQKRDTVQANGTDNKPKTEDAVVSSSEDKKKKKRSRTTTEPIAEAEPNVLAAERPRKKKRSKNAPTEIPDSTIAGDPAPVPTGQSDVPPVKKFKAYVPPKPQDPTPNPDGVTSTNHFDWNEHIFGILAKNNDEMSLDRLRRKIFRRYRSAHQIEEIPRKIEKTFNKKLRQLGLVVETNIVKINFY